MVVVGGGAFCWGVCVLHMPKACPALLSCDALVTMRKVPSARPPFPTLPPTPSPVLSLVHVKFDCNPKFWRFCSGVWLHPHPLSGSLPPLHARPACMHARVFTRIIIMKASSTCAQCLSCTLPTWALHAPGIALDVSIFVEVLTPLFPSLFLPIAALANIGTR
jgi:hypothetical protein